MVILPLYVISQIPLQSFLEGLILCCNTLTVGLSIAPTWLLVLGASCALVDMIIIIISVMTKCVQVVFDSFNVIVIAHFVVIIVMPFLRAAVFLNICVTLSSGSSSWVASAPRFGAFLVISSTGFSLCPGTCFSAMDSSPSSRPSFSVGSVAVSFAFLLTDIWISSRDFLNLSCSIEFIEFLQSIKFESPCFC